jgi:hypothetical protein
MALSHVPEKWTEKELPDLLHDPKAAERWKEYEVRHLEVAGPDEQDLLAFLPILANTDQRESTHKAGQRWVLNRDVHPIPAGDFEKVCNTKHLVGSLLNTWPELGHVLIEPQLWAGIHGLTMDGITFDSNTQTFVYAQRKGPDRTFLELIGEVSSKLVPTIWDGKDRFVHQDWKGFLA